VDTGEKLSERWDPARFEMGEEGCDVVEDR
jgi:hypothetical protein